MLQTEHPFTLPKGYVDEDGVLHREGVMRLARAADEILPLSDPRVEKNPAYLLILLFSRVIVKLGQVPQITPKTVEGLFRQDLAFLQDLFNTINGMSDQRIPAHCPKCGAGFSVEMPALGEYQATP